MTAADDGADYKPADELLTNTIQADPNAPAELDDADELTKSLVRAIERVPKPEWTNGGVPINSEGEYLDLPPLELPGFGESYDDCGDDLPLFCECCGATETTNRTCKRSVCPRCAPAWIRERALSRCARLDAVRRVLESKRETHQRYHHLAFSPPDDWCTADPETLDETFGVINDLLTAMGLEGVAFYHPWRVDSGPEADDMGKWKDFLFSDRDWEEVRSNLVHEPHFHVVALGHHVPGGDLTKRVHAETGWILERITQGENSRVSIFEDSDLARVVTYCLSHAGIDTDGDRNEVAMRTFGRHMNNGGDVDISVYPSKEKRMDKIVRKVVPKTLGVPMSTQLCTEHTVDAPGDGADDGTPSMQQIAMSTSGAADGAADGADDGADPFDLGPDGSELPDPVGVEGGEQAPPEPERSPCEGRMLHIKRADEFLSDDDWRAQAEHVDELQTTLDEWADRLDELGVGG